MQEVMDWKKEMITVSRAVLTVSPRNETCLALMEHRQLEHIVGVLC